jgi:hypothetical protein
MNYEDFARNLKAGRSLAITPAGNLCASDAKGNGVRLSESKFPAITKREVLKDGQFVWLQYTLSHSPSLDELFKRLHAASGEHLRLDFGQDKLIRIHSSADVGEMRQRHDAFVKWWNQTKADYDGITKHLVSWANAEKERRAEEHNRQVGDLRKLNETFNSFPMA